MLKADGSYTQNSYDLAGRIISSLTTARNESVILHREYSYDPLGRIVEEHMLEKNEYICYYYDKLSRVTSAIRRNRSTNSVLSSDSFSYDANGNILYGDNISSACYNSQNRMTCNNGVSFTYDNDGNMTYGYIGGKNMEFSYDSAFYKHGIEAVIKVLEE